MTSPVTSLPYSYYNVLNPNDPLTGPAPVAAAPADTTPAPAAPTAPAGGSGGVQLSSNVVALLQQLLDGSGTDASASLSLASLLGNDSNPTSALLGGGSTNTSSVLTGTPEGSINQQVYAAAYQTATNGAQQAIGAGNTGSQTVQNALSAYQSALAAGHPNPAAGDFS